MTTRERWIVYPLLFFALLSSLKDQLALPTNGEYESLTCKRLVVQAMDGRPLIELSSSIEAAGDQAGLFVMYGATPDDQSGKPRSARFELLPRPKSIELGSEPAGGYLRAYGYEVAPTMKFGHLQTARKSGAFAEDNNGQLLTPAGSGSSATYDWAAESVQPDASVATPEDATADASVNPVETAQ